MKKLFIVHNIDNTHTFSFTKEAIDLLRSNTVSERLPEVDLLYTYNTDDPNRYARYLHNGKYKESARFTNNALSKCIQFCLDKETELVNKADINQQSKPTVLDIFQDIKDNMSEDDQYQLATMLSSNVGYVLTAEDHDSRSISKTVKSEPVPEIDSGASCDYYRVGVTHPTSTDQKPYIAECNDIIESLDLTYAEANIFKEIWRSAAERTLGLKKAGNTNKRAAEKVVFFANRYYAQNVHKANLTDSRKVTK